MWKLRLKVEHVYGSSDNTLQELRFESITALTPQPILNKTQVLGERGRSRKNSVTNFKGGFRSTVDTMMSSFPWSLLEALLAAALNWSPSPGHLSWRETSGPRSRFFQDQLPQWLNEGWKRPVFAQLWSAPMYLVFLELAETKVAGLQFIFSLCPLLHLLLPHEPGHESISVNFSLQSPLLPRELAWDPIWQERKDRDNSILHWKYPRERSRRAWELLRKPSWRKLEFSWTLKDRENENISIWP